MSEVEEEMGEGDAEEEEEEEEEEGEEEEEEESVTGSLNVLFRYCEVEMERPLSDGVPAP
jgi:hypothetical protein